MSRIRVRLILPADRKWLSKLVREHGGARIVVSKGKVYEPENLEGFVASQDGKLLGALTYHIDGDECEIVTVDSTKEGIGVGSSLMEAMEKKAQALECRRLWLITTNDNLPALRFYQKRGFRLVGVHPNAMKVSRKLKPSIPKIGRDGIPLWDELELEISLR